MRHVLEVAFLSHIWQIINEWNTAELNPNIDQSPTDDSESTDQSAKWQHVCTGEARGCWSMVSSDAAFVGERLKFNSHCTREYNSISLL